MKRILAMLCITVIVSGLMYAAQYTILTELFKSLSCEYCPHVLEVYEEMYDDGLNIIPISFDEIFPDYNLRRNGTYSNITGGVPVAIFGGTNTKVGYNLSNPDEPQNYYNMYNDLINYDSPLTITPIFTFDNQGRINIATTIEVVGEISGTQLVAHTFFTLDTGPGSTIPHTDATRFKAVAWVNRPFVMQDGITTYDFEEQIPLQSHWSIDQLRAVVIVQEMGVAPKKIYQAAMVRFEGAYALQVSADNLSGPPNLIVNFTDNSYLPGMQVTSYAWDFNNDGIVDSTEESPTHTYTVPGLYSVTLTVTVADGTQPLTNTFTNMIEVQNPNNVSGTASGMWLAEHSPYIITGALAVARDRKLIINQGVTVKSATGVVITVAGDIAILGTPLQPILFTSNIPADTWGGITMRSTSTEVTEIHYATFEKVSGTALTITREANISNCTFSNNNGGSGTAAINFNGGVTSNLKSSLIKNNQASGANACAGITVSSSDTQVNISNCIFANNTANNVAGVRSASSGQANIINSTFFNNNLTTNNGRDIQVSGASVTIKNSIIGKGIRQMLNGVYTITYSLVTPAETGTGNITGDPLFANPSEGEGIAFETTPENWLLTTASPCVDAGDPNPIYNDVPNPADPTLALPPALGLIRNDIGAFGGSEPFGVQPPTPVDYNPPLNPVATAYINYVVLNWAEPEDHVHSPNLTSYKVFYNDSMLSTVQVPNLTYTHQSLAPATYSYTLSAVYTDGESVQTEPVSATVYNVQPPTNLQLTAPDTQTVNLTWQPPASTEGLSHYRVYRRDTVNPTFELLQDNISTTAHSDSGLQSDVTYYYYVTAMFANGESIASNIVYGPLETMFIPVGSLSVTIGFNSATLNWVAPSVSPSATLSGYRIERGETVLDSNLPANNTTFQDDTALNGQAYTYSITALYTDPTGESIAVIANAQMKIFNPVSNLSPTVEFNSVSLNWGAPSADPNSATLSGYRLSRGETVLGEDLPAVTTTYVDDTALNGQEYTYSVIALYADPTGEATPVTATAQLKVFNPPTLQVFSTEVVELRWIAPDVHQHLATLTGYQIYRDGVILANGTITDPNTLAFIDSSVESDVIYIYYIVATYTNPVGVSEPSNEVTGQPVSDYDEVIVPTVTKLDGNYPNPFNPETVIRFAVAKNDNVIINVYNVSGQLVRSLVNGSYKVGMHQAVWNGLDNSGRPVSSGIYFYRMNTSEYVAVKKMLLLK